MIHKLKKTAVVLAVLFVGIFMAATPAQAAPVDCPTGQICFWWDTNYSGSMVNYDPWYFGFGTCVNLPAWFNDQMSSWVSRDSTYGAYIYQNANCGGGAVDWGGPGTNHIYNWYFWGCNDCASSWRIITTG